MTEQEINQLKADAVMSFVGNLAGAYESGFIDSVECTIGQVYQAARNHVNDNYQIETKSLADEFDEEFANECAGVVPYPNLISDCGCRFESDDSNAVLLCEECSKLPCHNGGSMELIELKPYRQKWLSAELLHSAPSATLCLIRDEQWAQLEHPKGGPLGCVKNRTKKDAVDVVRHDGKWYWKIGA